MPTTLASLRRKSDKWMRENIDESEFFARWGKLLAEFRDKQRTRRIRYAVKNRLKMNAYSAAYSRVKRQENPEYFRARNRASYAKNQGLRREGARKQRLVVRNDPIRKESLKIKAKIRREARFKSDPGFKMRWRMRGRIWNAVHCAGVKKAAATFEILGCSKSEFLAHLQSTWLPGMTWENYGRHGWHIDHKRPLASFDLTDPEQQKLAFNYTNTQALWSRDNLSKGSKDLGLDCI